jgi:hypothetical protein
LQIRSKISNYKSIVNFEHSFRGDFTNLKYNPTFKSSAIFFVIIDKFINTKISFLNYWKIKNFNQDVSCQMTLRNQSGDKVLRKFFKIIANTYQISLNNILDKKIIKNGFKGSIEIEIHSSSDLKYSFPAIDAIYETLDGISLVHSNQRIFENFQDIKNNESINKTQTGFDIYLDDEKESFITAINGPVLVNNKELNIDFFNFKGDKLREKIKYKKINPYQSFFIELKNFKKLKKFLNNQRGFCKFNLPTENIFNRILAGTISRNKKKITTTHSYYDCSDSKDYIQTKNINKKEYQCYLPFNLIEGLDLEIVIYPIFSRTNINIALETYDSDFKRRTIKSDLIKIKKNFKDPKIINLSKIINQKNIKNYNNVYCLNIVSNNNKLPSRLTFGFNYKKNSMGSNISESMIVNHGKDIKGRGFYWGPAFCSKKIKTIIALSSVSKNKDEVMNEPKLIKMNLYGHKKLILSKKFYIKSPQALNLDIKKFLKSKKISNNEALWFTLETDEKNIICKHLHLSKNGHVSADHSF